MDIRKHSATSQLIRLLLTHSTTGAPLTGLTEASAGLIIGTVANNESATTRYRASSSEIETISTLGTYAAPTSGKCRFKEVDATNHPGIYEIQLADARFAVASAKRLVVSVSGAANLLAENYEIRLVAFDPDSATDLGLSRIDAAVSSRSSHTAADVWAVATRSLTTFGTLVSDIWNAATRTLTAFGFSVTVGTNNDKAGYALTSGERTAIADEVEAQIIDDTDSEKVLQAIVDKIAAANPSLDDLTLGAIASAVRSELATELARVDVATSTRLAAASYTAPDNAGITTLLGRLTATRAGLLDNLSNLDALISSRSTYAGADTAGTTTLLARLSAGRALLLDNLANLDAAISEVKDQTDRLTFDGDDQLAANVKKINDVTMSGSGVSGDGWRPV